MTKIIWIYKAGDIFKVFDTEEEAQAWFDVHDPEGVAFRHEVSELRPAGSADRYGVPMAADETTTE